MVRSHQMKHMLRRKPMTCVSTARRINGTGRYKATLVFAHRNTLYPSSSGRPTTYKSVVGLHRSSYRRA